jgi:hypothetical protein
MIVLTIIGQLACAALIFVGIVLAVYASPWCAVLSVVGIGALFLSGPAGRRRG